MRMLRVVRPCPVPESVVGGHCDRCNKSVYDLTRSRDPAGDVAQLGKACVRVLATAVVLGGCSAADVGMEPPVEPHAAAQGDAGADVSRTEVFVGEYIAD
jgi:hypothetical protein